MNSLLNIMKCRRGIREFADRPVESEILEKILEAAISAPSGFGDAHIFVVDDLEIRRQLYETCETGEREWLESQLPKVQERIKAQPNFHDSPDFLKTAPLLLVVTTRPRDPEMPYAVECAFLSVGYILVMVEGLGLGTTTYTPSLAKETDSEKLNRLLRLPAGENIQVILPIGYPKNKPEPSPGKDFYNVFHNFYGESFTL